MEIDFFYRLQNFVKCKYDIKIPLFLGIFCNFMFTKKEFKMFTIELRNLVKKRYNKKEERRISLPRYKRRSKTVALAFRIDPMLYHKVELLLEEMKDKKGNPNLSISDLMCDMINHRRLTGKYKEEYYQFRQDYLYPRSSKK